MTEAHGVEGPIPSLPIQNIYKTYKCDKNMKRGKKGALELSVGTIVIVVLAMTMLILGMVLVRTIMCGAVGLTGELNNKVRGEINDLFQSTSGEIVCIGSGAEPVSIIPGQVNAIYCSIQAPQTAEYSLQISSISGDILTEQEIQEWIVGEETWKGRIAPNDKLPKKVLRLRVPDNAPNDLITLNIEILREGNLVSSQQLDFEIKSSGFFKAAIC